MKFAFGSAVLILLVLGAVLALCDADATRRMSQTRGLLLSGLLEAAPDAMVVVNQSGEIVLLHVRKEIQLGYRRHELVGQKVNTACVEAET
jgi:PAS domain-containing protein